MIFEKLSNSDQTVFIKNEYKFVEKTDLTENQKILWITDCILSSYHCYLSKPNLYRLIEMRLKGKKE